jgi:hypothetical protein
MDGSRPDHSVTVSDAYRGVSVASAKAQDQSGDSFRSAEALLPSRECGGSHPGPLSFRFSRGC